MDTLVLCFHRVADPGHGGRSRLAISPDEFAAALDRVGHTRDFVGLDQVANASSTPRAVVTFDDGYVDNLRVALPILEARGIPATFFLSTGFIDTDLLFPPDALDGLSDAPPGALAEELKALLADGYWQGLEHLVQSPAEQYWRLLHSARDVVRESLLAEDPTRRPMTLSEVRELAASPLASLGPHTVSHRRLTGVSHREAVGEIEDSMRWLAGNSLVTVPYFAYPFGQVTDISKCLSGEIRSRDHEPLTTIPVVMSDSAHSLITRYGVPRLSVGPAEIAQWGTILSALNFFRRFPKLWLFLLGMRRRIQSLSAGRHRVDEVTG